MINKIQLFFHQLIFIYSILDIQNIEKPTKCINSRKQIEIKAQVQFIDFEGRSDGESLMKILSQLRPRRVIIVRGSESSTQHLANHCEQNIGSKVFTPHRGEIIDATTETHIYQVRLTEALLSQLNFQKGKDAEIAWINGQINIRNKLVDNTNTTVALANSANNPTPMEEDDHIEITDDDNKILTLEPVSAENMPAHNYVFINELKLADFKQVLTKNNIPSEISDGVLWCSNGTITLKRVSLLYFH